MLIPGYKIERLLAEGGMSSVYLATQESLSRRVAIKVLNKFDSPQQADRFLHEARIIASLQHRNIITIHDVGAFGARYYIAMEYLEGGSLTDRIDHGRGMPPIVALDLLESMASCLDFVHRRDVVHRDVKPSNILFHADGTPKLTDFGIAKHIDGNQELTLEGSAFGSPYYLSPEQAEDRPLDGRSDIYALGIVFYQMLTGRRPYEESSHIETIVAHLSNPIPVLPEALSGYQRLLEQMIAKSPENRIGSARELLALVRQLRSLPPGQAGGATVARREGWKRGGLARVRETSRWAKASMLTALLLVTIGMFWWPGIGDEKGDAPRLASRVRAVELSYETARDKVDPAVTADEPERKSVSSESVVPVPPLQPEASLLSEPLPEIAAASFAEPLEGIEPVTEAGIEEPAPEPIADVEPEVADDSSDLIDERMRAGNQALKANRLTTPASDNAYSHYLEVIELDQNHPGARRGIDKIADRYVVLARKALNKGEQQRARRFLQRGTKVQHNHAGLRMVRAELDELDRLAASEQVAQAEVQEVPAPKQKRIESWEFEGTSVTATGPEGTGNIVKDFKNVWRSVFD